MSDQGKSHEFSCGGKSWTVERNTRSSTQQVGLRFRRAGEVRFLAFTRGALPSERELDSMSREVLSVLLQRAVVQ